MKAGFRKICSFASCCQSPRLLRWTPFPAVRPSEDDLCRSLAEGKVLKQVHPFFFEIYQTVVTRFGIAKPDRARRWIIEIGSASCRERVCQYVEFSGVAGSLKKKTLRKRKKKKQ